jgi:DUF4097 and DUF4098 domain-containing protein YvlB
MKFPPSVPVLALGAAFLPSAGCVITVDSHSEILREERRFTVDGTPDVRVATFDGSIQVQSWERPGVRIEIEKRGPNKAAVEALEVVVNQKGNVIDLEVKRPRAETFSGMGLRQAAYARLVVSVPRTTNIRARSGDGAIRIDRVTGRIELRTGDGSIRASEVSGDLSFDTGDGAVVVERADGQLVVDTGDGSVTVSGTLGRMKLHTGDGSVIYRAEPGSRLIEPWDITTGDGSVTLYLPGDLGAELDAHTGDGRITNDLNIEKADGEDKQRRTLKGRLGAGGKLLRIRTGDGAIRLKMN